MSALVTVLTVLKEESSLDSTRIPEMEMRAAPDSRKLVGAVVVKIMVQALEPVLRCDIIEAVLERVFDVPAVIPD